jgi:Ca2+-binding EF-hand superfamily protein
MASTTYATDRTTIHSLFYKYDRDGSGDIDSNELVNLLSDLGVTLKDENELSGLLMLVDRDGNGTISFEEFFFWWNKMVTLHSFVRMEANLAMIGYIGYLFRNAQCTSNGTLTTEKFAQVYQQLYDTYHVSWSQVYNRQMFTTEQAIKELDKDGDGHIAFYELIFWLNWV